MNRGRLFEAIRVPFLLLIVVPIVAMWAGILSNPRDSLKLGLVMLPVVAALAVGVHRVVLLSPVEAFASGGFSGGVRRLLHYLIAALILLVLFMVISRLVSKGVLWLLAASPPRTAYTAALIAGAAVAAFALSRVILVLPAIAINAPRPLQLAWRLSRVSTIRIAFVMVAIPWIAQACLRLAFPRGTTWAQFTLLVILAAMLTVIHIAAISFAFRAANASVPPPNDPPA